MHLHIDISEILFVNFGAHFNIGQLKRLCQKCHALRKLKGALEEKKILIVIQILRVRKFIFQINSFNVY